VKGRGSERKGSERKGSERKGSERKGNLYERLTSHKIRSDKQTDKQCDRLSFQSN